MKHLTFLPYIFSLITLVSCQSQQSEYVEKFDWMVTTFQENDAGYPFYVEAIGEDELDRHLKEYRKKVKEAGSEQELVVLMNEWLYYFRKGHIGVYPVSAKELTDEAKDEIRAQYKDWERIEFNRSDFENYLNTQSIDPIEGIWQSGVNTIGIRKSAEADSFDAFIIEADSVYWMPGQINAQLERLDSVSYSMSYYTKNHVEKKSVAKWTNSSKSVVSMIDVLWLRQYPVVEPNSVTEQLYHDFVSSREPFLRRLSDKTLYLRIPSFMREKKEAIDKLLADNDNAIRSTQNLIIDIRYGTGGSDFSHYGLLPYYYCNPIRSIPLTFRATELNAQEYESYAEFHQDSATKSRYIEMARMMRESKEPYVGFGAQASVTRMPYASKYPARVAIICNTRNGSADEGFLYMARQSYKVKVFGTPTIGAFDYSNVNPIEFPDGKWMLWVAMSANKRLPVYKIDDIGIQPDFFIDDSVPESEWIPFVRDVIEE